MAHATVLPHGWCAAVLADNAQEPAWVPAGGRRWAGPVDGPVEAALAGFGRDHIAEGDDTQCAQDRGWEGHQRQWLSQPGHIRQADGEDGDADGADQQPGARPAAQRRAAGPQHQQHGQLGERRADEPAGPEQLRTGVEQLQQHREGEQVEAGAEQPEGDHEVADEPQVPALGPLPLLGVDPVGGDGGAGDVGKEVQDQDLAGQQGQEGQDRRGGGHAGHVAEVGADGGEHVLEGVGEGLTAQPDPLQEHP
jgi:hypothetical protein